MKKFEISESDLKPSMVTLDTFMMSADVFEHQTVTFEQRMVNKHD